MLFDLPDGFYCACPICVQENWVCKFPFITKGHIQKNMATAAHICWEHDDWPWRYPAA